MREAIQILASVGLVRVQHGKRTVVQEPSEWDVLSRLVQQAFRLEGRAPELTAHFYEVRRALEVNAAAWAAERATDEQRATLLGEVESMRQNAAGSELLTEFLGTDSAFHDTIAIAGGNIVLRRMTRNIFEFLEDEWIDSAVTGDMLDDLAEQHAAIADAIVAGDAEAARQAMDTHLRWAQQFEVEQQQRARSAAVRTA